MALPSPSALSTKSLAAIQEEVREHIEKLKSSPPLPSPTSEPLHPYYNSKIAEKLKLLLLTWQSEGYPDRILYAEILKLKVSSMRTMLQQGKTFIKNHPELFDHKIQMLVDSVVLISVGEVGIKFSRALAPEADVDWFTAFQAPRVNTLGVSEEITQSDLPAVVAKTPGQLVNEKIYHYINSSPSEPFKIDGFNLTEVEVDAAKTILDGVKTKFTSLVLPDKILIKPK